MSLLSLAPKDFAVELDLCLVHTCIHMQSSILCTLIVCSSLALVDGNSSTRESTSSGIGSNNNSQKEGSHASILFERAKPFFLAS